MDTPVLLTVKAVEAIVGVSRLVKTAQHRITSSAVKCQWHGEPYCQWHGELIRRYLVIYEFHRYQEIPSRHQSRHLDAMGVSSCFSRRYSDQTLAAS